MITSVVQRRRPRRPVLVLMGAAVVAAGLFAAVALAALVTDTGDFDVTVPDKDHSSPLVDIGNASVEYIGSSAANESSGTGIFDPFVRLQADPTEQGFNTDAAVTLDAKSGKWTHAIKVSAIPVVDCDGPGGGSATCWELFVDINENNTAKRVSLNDVEIWFTDSATLSPYPFTDNGTTTTKEYDFSGDIRINDVNQGSGRGDLRYLVPTAGHTWTADTYFVLYSQWGTTSGTAGNFGTGGYTSDGGFEEWKVRKTPNVSIVKTANPVGPVSAGTAIGFDITVSNTGVADATNVVISDPLPAGGALNWSLNPAFSGCAITGSVGGQTLDCTFATLAAGGSIGPIHITSPTTQVDCALVSNTATVTSGNDGGGSSSASVTVECAAIKILKNSTKGGAVANAGAVFAVDGPDAGTVADFSVTDDLTAAAPDEDADVGEVCVGGLAPGTYTVNETTPPSGYGGASQTNVSAVAVQGTNCTTSLPGAGATATFTNPPLSDIQVRFTDGGSGETTITSMTCNNDSGTSSTSDTTGWDDTLTVTGVAVNPGPTETIVCTIVIDP